MRDHFVPLTFVALIAIGQLGCQPPVASTQQRANGRTSQLKPHQAPLLNEAVFFEQLDDASLGEAADPAPLDPRTETNSEPCTRKTHEDLDATLWMQTSAEYYATCRQTYCLATTQLQNAIDDPTWSADLVQQSALSESTDTPSLPTAVILDIDETVLENSPYQARLIQTDEAFTPESWQQWVEEAAAKPIPGVKEFLASAEEAGVEVFFVTNRENAVENATRRNLEKLDLIQVDAADRILSKRERDEWTSDKATRRAHIAKRYRILLLIGDDLNDFVSIGNEPTAQTRREIAVEHAEMWGVKWMQLPNANYGGWERSIYDWNDSADDEVKLRKKYEALNNASAE